MDDDLAQIVVPIAIVVAIMGILILILIVSR